MSLKQDILTKFEHQQKAVPAVWSISTPLKDKVSEDDSYLPFYGYTSVFQLTKEDQKKCGEILERVMAVSGDMLIPLPYTSFHITAHEFANEYTVSKDYSEIDEANGKVLENIGELFHSLEEKYGDKKVSLRVLGPSTSGSDVVSIKFLPDMEEDEAILSEIFERSEAIWPVRRTYMPHVSLGYFKMKNFEKNAIDDLYQNLKNISNSLDMKVSFSIGDLVYQRHFSMEDFRDLYSVADMDTFWRDKCLSSVNM